jgi:hypothetical protein
MKPIFAATLIFAAVSPVAATAISPSQAAAAYKDGDLGQLGQMLQSIAIACNSILQLIPRHTYCHSKTSTPNV